MEKSINKMTIFDKERTIGEEHPVWSVLDKKKYVEDFYPKAEEMYDFIKSIVSVCGNVTKDGNTVPAMQLFFNLWNEYFSETLYIYILGSLVYPEEQSNSQQGCHR